LIEDIFLTYANHPLKENPQVLSEIVTEFENSGIIIYPWLLPDLNKIEEHFVTFAECNDLDQAEKIYRETKFSEPKRGHEFKIAFESVFGFRYGYCENECPDRWRRDVLGSERFAGPERLRCYECDRLFFRNLLADIVEGEEYKNVSGLESLLLFSRSNLTTELEIVENQSNSPFKQSLRETYSFSDLTISAFGNKDDKRTFRRIFLESFVAHALAQFLINNDRTRLKQCPECGNFFISSHRNRKFCSTKHKNAFNNRKNIASGKMREYKRKKRREGAKESYYG